MVSGLDISVPYAVSRRAVDYPLPGIPEFHERRTKPGCIDGRNDAGADQGMSARRAGLASKTRRDEKRHDSRSAIAPAPSKTLGATRIVTAPEVAG